MKHHLRRRRPFRPAPTRAQTRQQINRISGAMQLFQLEWLMESQQEQPNALRLRFLHDAVVAMRDEIGELEQI